MILNSDVASEWSRTTVGLEIAGLCRNGITFFVIGDLLSIEHDDCPWRVHSDFEFVPFPRFSLWVRQGFGQGIQHSRTVIFATHVAYAVVNLHLVARVYGDPLIRRLFRDADEYARIAIVVLDGVHHAFYDVAKLLRWVDELAHAFHRFLFSILH